MAMQPKLKYDWYQTDSLIVITILVKSVDETKLKIKLDGKLLKFNIPLENGEESNLDICLAHQVHNDEIIEKVTKSKIEVKLKKLDTTRWNKLEGVEDKAELCVVSEPPKYPTSSLKQKDWDKLVTTIEDDQPEGEAALNALFSKIYTEGSDEVRKAMNKSFTESGGTVLSTNWNEVKQDKVNIQPPQGLEFKKWD